MPKVSSHTAPRRSSSRIPSSSSSAATSSSCSSSQQIVGGSLASDILNGLRKQANPATKAWFENYVKGTTFIGCKTPVVRMVVKNVLVASLKLQVKKKKKKKKKKSTSSRDSDSDDSDNDDSDNDNNDNVIFHQAIRMLQQDAIDGKLAGMMLLQEHYPLAKLATMKVLDRLDRDILATNRVSDWSRTRLATNRIGRWKQ
jgi:hypothetical protein